MEIVPLVTGQRRHLIRSREGLKTDTAFFVIIELGPVKVAGQLAKVSTCVLSLKISLGGRTSSHGYRFFLCLRIREDPYEECNYQEDGNHCEEEYIVVLIESEPIACDILPPVLAFGLPEPGLDITIELLLIKAQEIQDGQQDTFRHLQADRVDGCELVSSLVNSRVQQDELEDGHTSNHAQRPREELFRKLRLVIIQYCC